MNSTIYVSEKAHPLLIEYLQQKNADIQLVRDRIGSPIGTHADLYYCSMGTGNVYSDHTRLPGTVYPYDCIYNAACTGRFFIHNTNITDDKLLAEAKKAGMTIIDVKQGYAKCSCVIVNEHSIITSDAGIVKKCDEFNAYTHIIADSCEACDTATIERTAIDHLLITPGHIVLDGFDYGFIGGTSGRIGDEIIFNGNLEAHPDHERIVQFITERGLKIKYFSEYPLTDIGSIIAKTQI